MKIVVQIFKALVLKPNEERAKIEKNIRSKFEKENESQLGELKKEFEEKSAPVKDLMKMMINFAREEVTFC